MTDAKPGDILAVRSSGFAGKMIRLGAALRDTPNLDNHIAVVHHLDGNGTLWCLEGRPGGVGWRDAKAYMASRWTLSNADQPKTEAQRQAVCKTAEAMIGTAYDWAAIAEDAGQALGLKRIWAEKAGGQVPGHVVCSSLAAYAYDRNGLAAPLPMDFRHVTPADWDQWILMRGWEQPSRKHGKI